MTTLDARGYLAWTLLGIIFFLRSLYIKLAKFKLFRATYSKFSSVQFVGEHVHVSDAASKQKKRKKKVGSFLVLPVLLPPPKNKGKCL